MQFQCGGLRTPHQRSVEPHAFHNYSPMATNAFVVGPFATPAANSSSCCPWTWNKAGSDGRTSRPVTSEAHSGGPRTRQAHGLRLVGAPRSTRRRATELRATDLSPAAFAKRIASSTARETGRGSRLSIHLSTASSMIASRAESSRRLPKGCLRFRGRNDRGVGLTQ